MKDTSRVLVVMVLVSLLGAWPASSANNAVAIGTVELLQHMSTSLQYEPETVTFTLSEPPATTWRGPFHRFVISPVSVTDAQTRKNLFAILVAAKASGQRIQVAFDNTGAFCDQGFMGIYYIAVL